MRQAISILLINPWITDFAAYNLWAEPLGLLYVASILREAGAEVQFIDCLSSTRKKNPSQKENGCSKYPRRVIEKPSALRSIERQYAVYGKDDGEFISELKSVGKPDAVVMTSHMTYWYPGVSRTIRFIRSVLGPRVPIILGGIYVKLCEQHARIHSGADVVFTDHSLRTLPILIEDVTGKTLNSHPSFYTFSDFPHPLHELRRGFNFFSVLTRRGCPFKCSYCASPLLSPDFASRSKESVLREIEKYTTLLNTKQIAFYDDALLFSSKQHIEPLLERIIEQGRGLSFHLPNGVHVGLMTDKIALLFFQSGVKTIRLGLETASRELQEKTGRKTTNRDYAKAVSSLRNAGYQREEVGTYIMAGLPGQTPGDVENSLDFVHRTGGNPHLSYFSPIPGTAIFKEAVLASPFPIEEEPLFQNNTIYILGNRAFSAQSLTYLKQKAVELRGQR